MVQPTDIREGNDITFGRRFNATWVRRVAVEGQVTPGIVIIVEVARKDVAQMPFIQHDDVVETLSPYGADDPFAVRILPGRAWCDRDFFDSHVLDAVLEIITVDAIAITDKKTRGFFVRKGVDDLLGRPFGVGICGDVEVNDSPPAVSTYTRRNTHLNTFWTLLISTLTKSASSV